jgi:CRP/FNR family transcriptional regulator, cyclic AMP receptor protein
MNPDELKPIAVLQAMDHDALARLAAALEDTHYTDGQPVFAEGDPGDSMYFIVHGCVRIAKRTETSGAEDKTLTVLEAGDYFGEMALLDQKPRSASAVASGDARVLRLSKAAFDQLQSQGSAAGLSVLFAMIRTSSERIRRLSAQLVVYDEVGKAIGDARDLQTLLDVILRQLAAATLADCGLFLLTAQFSEGLELRSQLNLNLSPAQRDAIAQGQGFLGLVLRDLQDRLVPDFETDASFKDCARLGFETRSLLLAPVAVEGKLLGLILLGGNAPDHFDLNALNLARGVARQAAQAILNARHREEEQARSRHSRQFVRF